MIRCVLLLCLLPAFAWAQGGRYVQCRSAEQQAQAKPGDRQAVQACVARCTGVERASGALKRCLCLQAILRADPSCPSVCAGYKPCPAARLPKKRCPADAKRAQASLDPAEHQACQASCGPHKRCQPTCDEAIDLSRSQPALAPRCAAVCGERAPECQIPLVLPPEPQPEPEPPPVVLIQRELAANPPAPAPVPEVLVEAPTRSAGPITLGAGAVALAAGGVFAWLAADTRERVTSYPHESAEAEDLMSDVDRYRFASQLLFVLGGGLVLGGGTWWALE